VVAGCFEPTHLQFNLGSGQLAADSLLSLKHPLTDGSQPSSPRSASSFLVSVRMGSTQELTSCILKIGRSEDINRELILRNTQCR
jgi:hypothetical protein